jgi:hypothetical protein
MDLGICEHLAESDDAAAIIGTPVLPDRNSVALVKIGTSGSPPVLIEVSDSVNYPVPCGMSGQRPIAPVGRCGAYTTPVLIGRRRWVPVGNAKRSSKLVGEERGILWRKASDCKPEANALAAIASL